MSEAATVPRPDWTDERAVRRLIAILGQDGAECRFVGGCVRDHLAGRPVRDIDIATPDRPDSVIARLRRAGLRVEPTGIEHGTVTAIVDGTPFEVTTLRRDVGTDGRRAVVAFTEDWREDAARRDFTFNAMSLTSDGRLFDYFGGWADLKAGIVRFVGNAQTRVAEDRLRVLRLFRFYAGFGNQLPDTAALDACRAAARHLDRLSGERIAHELLRLLESERSGLAAHLMIDLGVLPALIPAARDSRALRALVTLEGISAEAAPIRRLAALTDRRQPVHAADRVATRLRLSRRDGARLRAALAPEPAVGADHPVTAHRAACYRYGVETVRDRLLLAWAQLVADAGPPGRFDSEAWRQRIAMTDHWTRQVLPVGGADVQALGIGRGPRIGRLLRALEAWWIDGDFQADRQACLDQLAALAADSATHAN